MNEFIKRFSVDRILWWGMTASLVCILLSSIYLVLVYKTLPPFLPLFNQMPWGETRLVNKIDIFLPLLITTAIFLLNIIISYVIYDKLTLVSRIISITSFLTAFLMVILVVRVTLLVL